MGLSLAVFTALGCVAYEKIVKGFSLSAIIFLATIFYVPLLAVYLVLDPTNTINDIYRLFTDPKIRWYALIYWATWITTPIWFYITKKQGVMVGSIYEVKYIFVLAVFYLMVGDRPMTANVITGIVLALFSIYFISK